MLAEKEARYRGAAHYRGIVQEHDDWKQVGGRFDIRELTRLDSSHTEAVAAFLQDPWWP